MATPAQVAEKNDVKGPVSALQVPRFCSATTFARIPMPHEITKPYDLVVVGCPFDSGTSFRPGARFGPGAVRNASRLLRPYNPALDLWPFHQQQCMDAGDLALNPFNIQESIKTIETAVDALIKDGQKLLTIGGDHTIALPLLRSINKVHGPVSLIHFDAHLDTWDTYFGEPYTHGTPFRRAAEEKLFLDDASMHVGIRGPVYSPNDFKEDSEMGFKIIHCAEFEGPGGIERVIERICARVKQNPVYISIDIDVLDPCHAPGTGTPECGGMTSRELLGIIRGLAHLNVVGADVVEVAPAYDHAEITSFAASSVCYELMGCMTKKGFNRP